MRRTAACKRFEGPKVLKDESLGDAHTMLEEATVSLQNNKPVITSFESLYSRVVDFLEPRFADVLWQRLETLIENHTKAVFDDFEKGDLEQVHFLHQLNECWKNHCRQLHEIRAIFLFLDRKYVLANSSIMSIWDLGIEKFRQHFSRRTIVQKRALEELLDLIKQERQGTVIDRGLVKDLLGMMSSLSVYQTLFEPRFIEETQILYRAQSQQLINEYDVPAYLKYVDRIIAEETERSSLYLESLTRMPLIRTVETELIQSHLDLILKKGLSEMLDDMRTNDLLLLHALSSRIPNGLSELCSHFNKQIKQRGQLIVSNSERDKFMVQDLLLFKEKMDRVVIECFMKQERFINSLKEAFEHFINQRPNKPAELIAKYIDSKLKSGNKEATEDELERTLDRILVLFRFIHGKDVFEAFYKKDLAKRLLVNKSASVDAEKSMLSKLKRECGAAFTGKLEGMFKDIELSRDLMSSFKNHMTNQRLDKPIDLVVHVLTMGYWPTYQPIQVNLPSYILDYYTAFEKYYSSKHSGRRLQWQPNLGQCTLIAHLQGKHELIVSVFQALVLLLFNDKDEYSLSEIAELTKIENLELKRTVQSLAVGKVKILTKEPRAKEVSDEDKLTFNARCKLNLYKMKINSVQLKETPEEKTLTEDQIFLDRQYQIDAAIVRIMKTRRKLTHNELLTEIFQHLKFPVRGQDVKVRIESLIERDYLHRSEDDSSIYEYVA